MYTGQLLKAPNAQIRRNRVVNLGFSFSAGSCQNNDNKKKKLLQSHTFNMSGDMD